LRKPIGKQSANNTHFSTENPYLLFIVNKLSVKPYITGSSS